MSAGGLAPDEFDPNDDDFDATGFGASRGGDGPGDVSGNGRDDADNNPEDDANDDANDDAGDDEDSVGAFGGDEDDDDDGGDDDDGTAPDDAEARPAVFVTTREPVTLLVSQLDDPRAPDSSALAAYIDGRMVARSAMPAEAIARLLDLKLFDSPVSLGLFAFEDDPGLQCRLFALVPRGLLEGAAHEAEPWKESVPSFEAALRASEEDDDDDEDDDDESAPFETILLGHIVRFAKDRQHPDNLAAEAVDILQRIIHGAESLEDADRKAIDDLLGSL